MIAGNAYLCRQAATYVEPAKVHLIPTCVDPRQYPSAVHRRRGARARLVWIGQHSTLPCLSRAEPLLAAATRRSPGLELHVICNRFPTLSEIRVVPRPWDASTEAAEVAAADIGISWLPDDPWSLGKCGLKVLQYMAAGLPVVANPVGMNCQMIRHGETGFLASTPEEWAEAISTLADDPELRGDMGRAARKLVCENYSVPCWADRFAALVDRVARQVSPQEHSIQLPQHPQFVQTGGAAMIVRSRHPSGIWSLVVLACVGLCVSCASHVRWAAEPPQSQTAVHGQLIVHSDFALPKHHRLMDELMARRGDLSVQLGLPVSERANSRLFVRYGGGVSRL